jgi:hypothetical protein
MSGNTERNLKNKLVHWFMTNEEELYHSMYFCDHSVDFKNPMKYHTEGTVWTHTLMVMAFIEGRFDFKVLLIAGLLHDIGKPKSRTMLNSEERGDYYTFRGHEGHSTMLSLSILDKMQEEFGITLEEKTLILKIVSLHGVALESLSEPLNLDDYEIQLTRNEFRLADKSGATRHPSVKDGDYKARKFSSSDKVQDDKEIVLMTGLPCSGKSTYINEHFKDHHVISRDNSLTKFYMWNRDGVGDNYNTMFKWVNELDKEDGSFTKFFNDSINQARKGHDKVVVDMTMMSMSSRRKILNRFPKHTRKSVVMLPTLKTLARRNDDRSEQEGKYIPSEAYFSMTSAFVIPTLSEGFSSIELVF